MRGFQQLITKSQQNLMTDLQYLEVNTPTFQTRQQISELLKEKDEIIIRQENQINQLQEKMKKTVENAKRMRENQLFDLFKKKYEQEARLRSQFEKSVLANMNLLMAKLNKIEYVITRNLSQQTDTSSSDIQSEEPSSNKVSMKFSSISKISGIVTKTIDIGEVTQTDAETLLAQAVNKVEFLDIVSEMMALKYEKYSMECKNVHRLIRIARRQSEEELKQCQDELQILKEKNSALEKQMSLLTREKARWREAFSQCASFDHRKKLLKFDKDDLIQEIIKLMYCLKSMEKKKDQKSKQLEQFKEGQKKRYEQFLLRIKSYKK